MAEQNGGMERGIEVDAPALRWEPSEGFVAQANDFAAALHDGQVERLGRLEAIRDHLSSTES